MTDESSEDPLRCDAAGLLQQKIEKRRDFSMQDGKITGDQAHVVLNVPSLEALPTTNSFYVPMVHFDVTVI